MFRPFLTYMESLFAKEFLLDTYKFSTTSQILEILPHDVGFKIKLSNTIFHPQGGGQPNDTGNITQNTSVFQIKSAEHDRSDNNVWHIGSFVQDSAFDASLPVEVRISEETRRLNARLHSGGHLLDVAVKRLGYPLEPGKGYHFAEGSYVEYIGNIVEKEQAIVAINAECEKIIAEAEEMVESVIMNQEEARKAFEVPSYLAGESTIRYVRLTREDKGCPCGGTHVRSVREIGKVVVTKMVKKGKNLRVSYRVE
jgi:Ser-tRNA(Ala) deacylase AlaX